MKELFRAPMAEVRTFAAADVIASSADVADPTTTSSSSQLTLIGDCIPLPDL